MKQLRFHYYMEIRFDIPVHDHHFTLRCLPKEDGSQINEEQNYEVRPYCDLCRGTDAFGNEMLYGSCREPHKLFLADVYGIVQTGCGERISETASEYIYRYQTLQTAPGVQIRGFYKELEQDFLRETDAPEQKDVTGMAVFFMHRLNKRFQYRSGITLIDTTAEEAFEKGMGVCQDYAHIFLSLLRLARIPCRYVSGMMTGEGFSHAWVEIRTPEGWIGLDPTNDRIVGDDYIRIAKGRDYKDCLINRGIFKGCVGTAFQEQMIRVEVKEIGEKTDGND